MKLIEGSGDVFLSDVYMIQCCLLVPVFSVQNNSGLCYFVNSNKENFYDNCLFVFLSFLSSVTVVFGSLTYSISAVETLVDALDLFSLVMNLFPPWQKNMLHEPSESPAG